MSPDALLRQFDVLADAPNGVQKLRELILQLAVRGKLVPQDPSDEPASVLLERIAAEKERLFREGKIVKPRPLPPISEKDLPSALPKRWLWTRLANVAEVEMGNSPPGTTYNTSGEGLPLINGPSEFSPNPLGHTVQKQYTSSPAKTCRSGDLLICVRGATTGRTNISGFEACIGRGVASIHAGDLQPYINRFVVSRRKHILGLGSGSTFPSVSYRHIAELCVPLPPLSEQRRIVAKVDELMALCDRLEERQQRRAEARARLNRSALHHLTAASDDADLAGHWQRVRENLHLLYDTPDTVAELRQAVLQLAVRGKLVPQDPGDEPAGVLLERIAAEKERLFKDGKIGKLKLLPSITEDELPFNVPEGWEWGRFVDVARIASNLVDPTDYSEEPHVAPDNIEKRSGRLLDYRSVREDAVRSNKHRFFPGQILYSKIRPNLSKAVLVDFGGLCSADMYPVDTYISAGYLLKYILSSTFLSMAVRNDTRVAMPKINQSEISRVLVPVPPLPEQHRIVAKVDELMALCDALEARLTRAREKSAHLAASVVHHLTTA